MRRLLHTSVNILILCFYSVQIGCEDTSPAIEAVRSENDVGSSGIEYVNPGTNGISNQDSIAIEEEDEDHLMAGTAILKKILSPDIYDKNMRPKGLNGTGSPVKVYVSLYIRNIENIDDEKMEYSVQMTFREMWNDPRLKYSHVHPHVQSLTLMNSDNIWIPDVFFSNEKTGSQHDLMVPNFFGRISKDGEVMVSYRITLLLSCPMQLEFYPLDTQSCPLRMASYGYTEKDLDLDWRPENTIQMARQFIMPRFHLNSYALDKCESITSTGSYGCIQLFLEFEREFGYYLIQIYAPCIMLVLVSWVAFWLEPTATEARVSLAVTAILTVVTQVDGINENVPPASYIKAIDIWTFMIQFLVFAAILQFSYINYVVHYEWKQIAKSLDETNDYLRENKTAVLKERSERKAKRIDNICKVCFPLTFGLFNIAYWTYFLRSPPYEGIPV